MLVVKVDRLHAQTRKARVARLDDVIWPAIRRRLALGRADVAELRGDHGLLAIAVGQRAAHQLFVLAVGIGIRGVEEVRPRIEGFANGGDGFLLVHRPVESRHGHASQTECGDFESAFAEAASLHDLRRFVEPALNGIEYGLVLPAGDPPRRTTGRAPSSQGTLARSVGPRGNPAGPL